MPGPSTLEYLALAMVGGIELFAFRFSLSPSPEFPAAAVFGPEGSLSGTATLTFPIETLNSGGAYLLRDGTLPLPGNLRKNVPLVALDDVALRRPVRLIKMDVEGAEPQVIRGAARLLREDRPIILSELHPTQLERASGVGADAFLAELRGMGYRAHVLGGQGQVGAVLERAPAEALVSVVFLPAV